MMRLMNLHLQKMTMMMTKGHHGSLQQRRRNTERFKTKMNTNMALNSLILGLVLAFTAGTLQIHALNIANGPASSSSMFRSSLAASTTTTTTSTPVPTTITSAASTPSSSSTAQPPTTTTTTVSLPFIVSPTPAPASVVVPPVAAAAADVRSGKGIQLANTPFIRLNRMNTGSRTNSRFLRTFPPLEYLEFARRESLAKHGMHRPHGSVHPATSMLDQHHHPMSMIHSSRYGDDDVPDMSDEDFRFDDDDSSGHDSLLSNQLGNSPIFYIKLPPAPYVLVPGLGYVSPHPYQNNNNNLASGSGPSSSSSGGASPMMMSPLGAFDFGSSLDAHPGSHPSSNSPNNNVISLPLKFVSNARPAIIVGAKPDLDNGIHGDDKDSGKHTTLLSGGKYSFNGRPNGVFIVRSPAVSRTLNRRQRQRQRSYSSAGAAAAAATSGTGRKYTRRANY